MPTKKIRKGEFHRMCTINMKVGGLAEITGFLYCSSGYVSQAGMKKVDTLSSVYSISQIMVYTRLLKFIWYSTNKEASDG